MPLFRSPPATRSDQPKESIALNIRSTKMSDLTPNQLSYSELIRCISDCLEQGRKQAAKQVNVTLLETYWQIGQYIVEFEQGGQERAEHGSRLLQKLAKDLKTNHGKGFSRSNLQYMRLLYLVYPRCQTLSGKLSWSHYTELLAVSDELARSFYEQQCIRENWSVRELKRQKETALFERVALSKDREEILALAKQGQAIESVRDVVKDPYVFEFLDLPERNYRENELEQRLIEKLEQFLLELGKGFAFIGQQYRITLNNTHFFVDLVFYHRILKCFVLIDLKTRAVTHQDIGQMNLYLNYFRAEENVEDDHEPIGIVLARDKDEILVEYATGSISNQLFVSRYQLYLPDREMLRQEIQRILETNDG
jgi:predicted nuclease of restriction endonuclease-like (RecB) superfamily